MLNHYSGSRASSIILCIDGVALRTFEFARDNNLIPNLQGLMAPENGGAFRIGRSQWLLVLPGGILVLTSMFIILNISKDLKLDILMPLQNDSNKEVKELLDQQKLARETEKFKATYQVAKQVAHDIRSPLSCLDTIAKRSDNLNENEKSLIERSVERINEVAEDLLNNERNKNTDKNFEIEDIMSSNQQASESNLVNINFTKFVLDSVEFKALEYSKNTELKIISDVEPKAENINFSFDPKMFKRALSDLINNAVESLKENQPSEWRGQLDALKTICLNFHSQKYL